MPRASAQLAAAKEQGYSALAVRLVFLLPQVSSTRYSGYCSAR